MSDERFFSQVNSTMHNYAPAVADGVYAGMRRKLWWSNFTKLSASRFNMWYLLLLFTAAAGATTYYFGASASADVSLNTSEISAAPMQAVSINECAMHSVIADNSQAVSSCCSASKQKANSTLCAANSPAVVNNTIVVAENGSTELIQNQITSEVPVLVEASSELSIEPSNQPEVLENAEVENTPPTKYRGSRGLKLSLQVEHTKQ